MKKSKKIITALSIVLSGVLIGFGVLSWVSGITDSFKNLQWVSWPILAQLDIESGFVPPILKTFSEKEIKLAGFVVPLTDNFNQIREFLLVPDPMSCIHVPPPPTNQMVLVTLDSPMNSQLAYGPVWVKGELKIKKHQTEFGVVSYEFKGDQVKVYEDQPFK